MTPRLRVKGKDLVSADPHPRRVRSAEFGPLGLAEMRYTLLAVFILGVLLGC